MSKSKMDYYLICALCGEQVHFRETGKDKDKLTVIETWPCDHCQGKKGVKDESDY